MSIVAGSQAGSSAKTAVKWSCVRVTGVSGRIHGGQKIFTGERELFVAGRYPTSRDGRLLAGMTQERAAIFIGDYNASNGTDYIFATLREDNALRAFLGSGHEAFDENFGRGCPGGIWSYCADFTRPHRGGRTVLGIGQSLVVREAGISLPSGRQIIGPVTIAPDGMVPELTKRQFEKIYKIEGLKKLALLRGREIHENDGELLDFTDPLGYSQFTLPNNAKDAKGKPVPRSYHQWSPGVNQGEAVAVRGSLSINSDRNKCFDVYLCVDSSNSRSYRSFPQICLKAGAAAIFYETVRPAAAQELA